MREKLFLVLANLFWAGHYVIGKSIIAETGPFWLTLIRWCVAFIVLAPISYWLERPRYQDIIQVTICFCRLGRSPGFLLLHRLAA
ncbi:MULTISPECIES: EamA family transporter [Geobacillus]|uniref:EamA domain-containing protein n=1 Tax=Geobacillus thermocatenulatus TaxID=33938 RepID=A0A226Q3C8_9BACL|nr:MULTISPECIES: EamA family transporter [Geobacillus]KPD00989.1 hypothetical protein LR69_00770 [Geobacillus sp. BCO2]RAN23286.1 hypothetical protein VC88_06935 [Geobacillus sp. A8]ASS99704.1 hypothetical protein GT3921_12115 [Geobacillus thermocatenulatus]KLR72833.1 hypothetical protein ABH20_14320 [Geobacillus sp. T6]OXB86109.1 hypothetical protein B9L19_11135 [Geobacillus thermocatenulatus]